MSAWLASPWRERLERGLEAMDGAFDAVANLLRVIFRGRFGPDERSYRGAAYAEILPKEVLLEELTLNAEDAAQAKRVVALDPDRYLALAPEAAAFDVAGPMDEEGAAADAGPERRYLLGVTRRDVLEGVRREAGGGLLAPVEAFAFHPRDYPDLALVFHDEAGDKQRRARRLLLLVGVIGVLWSGAAALGAWRDALTRGETRAEAEEAEAQRRIRLEERQLVVTRASLAKLEAGRAPPLASALDTLSIVGRRQPPDAELTGLEWTPKRLSLEGRSYSPASAELELRRGFQKDAVSFEAPPQGAQATGAQTQGAPASFKAAIDLSAGDGVGSTTTTQGASTNTQRAPRARPAAQPRRP
jgi:hypothetical protein